jgi:hypothetical protein
MSYNCKIFQFFIIAMHVQKRNFKETHENKNVWWWSMAAKRNTQQQWKVSSIIQNLAEKAKKKYMKKKLIVNCVCPAISQFFFHIHWLTSKCMCLCIAGSQEWFFLLLFCGPNSYENNCFTWIICFDSFISTQPSSCF